MSSSRSGCRRLPGSPGYRFSHHVPPTPAFFSMMVKGMPARASRMPASSPDIPAPMTTTWNRASFLGRDVVRPVEVSGVGALRARAPRASWARTRREPLGRPARSSSRGSPRARAAGRKDATAVAVGHDDLEGQVPDGGLILGRHEPLDLVEVDAGRPQVDPGGWTGPRSCGPSTSSGRGRSRPRGRGDGLVVVGDRSSCPGDWLTLTHGLPLSGPGPAARSGVAARRAVPARVAH